MSNVPHVVIIGGSAAGIAVAKSIDTKLGSAARVTVFDERDSHYFTIASIRIPVEKDFANKVWVPYTNLFVKNPNSKVVQAKVAAVNKSSVTLSDGSSVAFDYAVVATGVTLPPLAQSAKTTKAEGLVEGQQIFEAVKKAKTVTIIGGGPVGCELAGEIATDYRDKKVTIVQGAPGLLPHSPFNDKARAQVAASLRQLGVEVILNDKVVSGAPDISVGFSLVPSAVTTASGKTIQSDVVFLATGGSKPHSDLVSPLGSVLDAKGFIKVLKTGQLESYPNIFSLGDVSNLDQSKLAYLAGSIQGPLVGGNIVSLIQGGGKSAALKSYTPSTQPAAIGMLALGRNGGVFQTPLGVFGNWTTKSIKSGTLLVDNEWKSLNAAPPKN